MSDAQFSVVSVVAAAGPLQISAPLYAWSHQLGATIEATEYEPYGRNRRIHRADFNLDGIQSGDDMYLGMGAHAAGSFAADANGDGILTIDDLFQIISLNFTNMPANPDAVVGSKDWGGGLDNPYGYCGYYADMETLGINGTGNGFLYHVRHRVYDPIAGRWLQRDPAGFVDGMNLYEYCGGGSVSCFDPMGLQSCAPKMSPARQQQEANKDPYKVDPQDSADEKKAKRIRRVLDRNNPPPEQRAELEAQLVQLGYGSDNSQEAPGAYQQAQDEVVERGLEETKNATNDSYSARGMARNWLIVAGVGVFVAVVAGMVDDLAGVARSATGADDADDIRPRGSSNPNTKSVASRGSSFHADKPGHLPDQMRSKYPETEFEFTPPGTAGQDVKYKGGKHPSKYPNSDWPAGVDHADFKPDSAGGKRTFRHDQRRKWTEPTHMLPYDSESGKLK